MSFIKQLTSVTHMPELAALILAGKQVTIGDDQVPLRVVHDVDTLWVAKSNNERVSVRELGALGPGVYVHEPFDAKAFMDATLAAASPVLCFADSVIDPISVFKDIVCIIRRQDNMYQSTQGIWYDIKALDVVTYADIERLFFAQLNVYDTIDEEIEDNPNWGNV